MFVFIRLNIDVVKMRFVEVIILLVEFMVWMMLMCILCGDLLWMCEMSSML